MISTHWKEVYISSGTIMEKLENAYLASCSADELLNLKRVIQSLNNDIKKTLQEKKNTTK